MDLYGIIGYPLGHSRSPQYFNEYFQNTDTDAKYLCFELKDIRDIEKLLAQYPLLKGFNVTIPHKQNILPYLDEISDEARTIGAVNCVKIEHRNNCPFLSGYNTDVYGFRKALLDFIPHGICRALVLGNGGAAKAVRHVLHSLSMEVLTVSRTPRNPNEIGYAETNRYLPEFRLIVNT
ncbi:MAG: shikimate dehydrogenase, partial [Odoribacter sp.]|nr:shikimate dehydrogenase [Odoribacter sp.]